MAQQEEDPLHVIKVGDRVWVSAKYGNNERGELKTVKRLTPTRIILDGQYPKYNTYYRGKRSRYSGEPTYYGVGMSDGRITYLATQEECDRWDAEQNQKRAEADAARQKREQDEKKRGELAALFPERTSVDGPHRNTWGEWRVTFFGSEDEMRVLASRIAGTAAPAAAQGVKRNAS